MADVDVVGRVVWKVGGFEMELSSYLAIEAGAIAGLIAAYFVVPILLARRVVKATWLQVACAYPVWLLALWLLLGGPSNSIDEGIGWTLIMAMFFSWAGVPIAAFVLRKTDMPYRAI